MNAFTFYVADVIAVKNEMVYTLNMINNGTNEVNKITSGDALYTAAPQAVKDEIDGGAEVFAWISTAPWQHLRWTTPGTYKSYYDSGMRYLRLRTSSSPILSNMSILFIYINARTHIRLILTARS